jgi:transposase InsO family protein
MIERFFRTIKHRWFYFRSLPNIDSVQQATDKFMHEDNNIIPHSALGGATPFAVFTGKWTKTEQIAFEHLYEVARENRRHANLNSTCGFCPV